MSEGLAHEARVQFESCSKALEVGGSHRKSMRQHSQAKQSTRDTRKMGAALVIFPGPAGSAGLKPGGLKDLTVSSINVSAQAHFASAEPAMPTSFSTRA